MKPFYKAVLICVGILITSCSSEDSSNNDQETQPSGLLKTMEIHDIPSSPYVYDFYYNDDNTIDEIHFFNFFTDDRKDKFYYNSQGNIDYVESILLSNNEVAQTVNFTYNASGQLINETKIDNTFNDQVIERRDYFYENGMLSCFNYCYDSDCNSYQQICYDYDSNGNAVTTTYYDDNGQTLFQRDITVYDNTISPYSGSNIPDIIYTTNPAFGLSGVVDDINNPVSRTVTTYFPNGDVNLEFTTNYVIDFNASNRPTRITSNEGQTFIRFIAYEYY